jgi:aminoglycoside 3-N-acetyltransferase
MNFDYTREELYQSLKNIISRDAEIIFVSGDLTRLGRGEFKDKKETLDSFYDALINATGKELTIVVPTFSQNLANTDIAFEPKKTPTELGVFPNYILQKNESVRSFHPFTSFAAIGAKAEYICGGTTKFPYGFDSPYDRILSLEKTVAVSIGLEPLLTCSLVHHAEFNMHVPYRYIKEFAHPVKISDSIKTERFYMHVVYRELNENRNLNRKFFENFERSNEIKHSSLGKSLIYSYDMRALYTSVIGLMKKDIYSWMTEEPVNKPYTL